MFKKQHDASIKDHEVAFMKLSTAKRYVCYEEIHAFDMQTTF